MSRLLMISTDRKIFEEGSDVRARQIEYAKGWKEVHILIFAGRNVGKQQLSPNCYAYSTRSFLKIFGIFDAIRFGTFLIERYALTNITCQDPFLTGLCGAYLKRRYGLSLEVQVHGDIGSPYFGKFFLNKIRLLISKYVLPQADSVRVVSERIKKYIEQTYRISKIEVRPIEVDIEHIKHAPIIADLHSKYPQFGKIVLMASRLEKEKRIDLAIRAFRGVKSMLEDCGLVIVGSGSELSKLKATVTALKLDQNVVFEGWANSDTLASYYKTADVFLNTSAYEGYGMTMIEAKAAGCPVVSTDVGIARESGAHIVKDDLSNVSSVISEILTGV